MEGRCHRCGSRFSSPLLFPFDHQEIPLLNVDVDTLVPKARKKEFSQSLLVYLSLSLSLSLRHSPISSPRFSGRAERNRSRRLMRDCPTSKLISASGVYTGLESNVPFHEQTAISNRLRWIKAPRYRLHCFIRCTLFCGQSNYLMEVERILDDTEASFFLHDLSFSFYEGGNSVYFDLEATRKLDT